MIVTTIDYQKLQDWRAKRLCCHFRLSVVVAIARGQFFALVENLRFAVEIVILSVIVPEVCISGFSGYIAISGCRSLFNHFSIIYTGSPWSKILDLPLEFQRYLL